MYGGLVMKKDSVIEAAMKEAEASLNIEGLYTTEEQNELIRRCLAGELSHDDFVQKVLGLAKRNRHE